VTDLPRVHVTTDDALTLEVDALVVPVFRGAIEGPGAEAALQALGLTDVPRDGGFRGKLGETLDLAAPGLACGRVTLVGLGRMDELDDEQVRRAAGAATRALAETVDTLATTLPLADVSVPATRAVAEGAILGAYRYLEQRSDPTPIRLTDVTLVVPSSLADPAVRAVEQATVHARAQCLARDLVNTPAAEQSPQAFCDRVGEVVAAGVTVEVWDEQRLATERCGGLLAVGQGSSRPPRLLLLRYTPADPIATVVLVGKGIVFDSGGLSLKRPYTAMAKMKADMSGAAVVAAVFAAIADLDLPVAVVGLCALAENLPSGEAQRPSDVFTARNGTTVEVRNTDAEGRLVMADALSYAAELDPDAIVDVATLTGAAVHAVGARATGAFGNDDDLLRQILAAAEAAGEPSWHLPLWEDLRENLESEVADIDNLGVGDQAGATMAGLFLREFVDDQPWVHLDIAGPAWAEKARYHLPKEATGTGVRTLLRWLELTHA
jgi:leucyl aminopeptidase